MDKKDWKLIISVTTWSIRRIAPRGERYCPIISNRRFWAMVCQHNATLSSLGEYMYTYYTYTWLKQTTCRSYLATGGSGLNTFAPPPLSPPAYAGSPSNIGSHMNSPSLNLGNPQGSLNNKGPPALKVSSQAYGFGTGNGVGDFPMLENERVGLKFFTRKKERREERFLIWWQQHKRFK